MKKVVISALLILLIIPLASTSFLDWFTSGAVSGCIDTDEGVNYYEKGIAKEGDKELTDYCVDENYLIEALCKDDELSSIRYYCLNGCIGGACLSKPNETTSKKCEEGTYQCRGDILQICIGEEWVTKMECKFGCREGKCLFEPVNKTECEEGSYRCNGSVLQFCSRGKWITRKKCEFGCRMRECLPQPITKTECEKQGGYCISWDKECKEGYIRAEPMGCKLKVSARCCLPKQLPAEVEEKPPEEIDMAELLLNETGFGDIIVHPQDDDVLFAIKTYGVFGDLFVSKDGGLTWNHKMPMGKIVFDNINPNIVYGINGGEIYRSEDGGETFSLVNKTPYFLRSILADKFISEKIYLGLYSPNTDAWGIYVSEDGGDTLEFKSFRDSIEVPPEYLNASIGRIPWDIDQDPQNGEIIYITSEDSDHSVYASGLWPDPYFIIRTLDGGDTFEAVSEGLPWHSLVIVSFIDSSGTTQWIAGTEGPGLYKLNLQEKKWSHITSSIYVTHDYLIDPINPQIHYIAIGECIQKSTDGGNSWESIACEGEEPTRRVDNYSYIVLPKPARVVSLALDSKGNLFFVDYFNGIFRITSEEIEEVEEQPSEEPISEEPACDGCLLEQKCLPYGTRTKGLFCSLEGNMEKQKTGNQQCENDFECESNLCINNKCLSKSLWDKILSFFRRFFRIFS